MVIPWTQRSGNEARREFAQESFERTRILQQEGRGAASKQVLQKLYPVNAEFFGVAPSIYVFRGLFRAFAGAVADVTLPKGCFFSGSAVVAALSRNVRNDDGSPACNHLVVEHLNRVMRAEEKAHNERLMLLRRLCDNKSRVARLIMSWLGTDEFRTPVDQLRQDIVDAGVQGEFKREDPDVFDWTDNGFGLYARSDIDIFVSCLTAEEGNRKVRSIFGKICAAVGYECVAVRTPNTVTICRSWPERHVQIILLTLPEPGQHLLFADMDCTAVAYMEGEVYINSRSRRAFYTGSNTIPLSMLRNRKDTPKRVAAYAHRGFRPLFMEDLASADDATSELLDQVEEEMQWEGKKLFNMFCLDDEPVAFQRAVDFLWDNNTAYGAFNCPRMLGLKACHIEGFFRRMDLEATKQGKLLVATIVEKEEQLPTTLSKLEKSSSEAWVAWGFV